MKLNRIVPGILLVMLASLSAVAQGDLTKTVEVTRAYDPIISDADKLNLTTEGYDTLLNFKSAYTYSILPQGMQSSFALRPIPAAKINGKAYEDPQWLYARLGAGYPLQFLGDLYLNNIKPDDLSFGLFYNHRSIWTNIDNNGRNVPADEMNHGGGVYLRKYWEPVTLGIEGGFNQHKVLFYGYNTATMPNYIFNKDSLTQSYMSYYVSALLKSNDTDTDAWKYRLGITADIYADNGDSRFHNGRMFSQNENTFDAKAFIGKGFGANLFGIDLSGAMYLRKLKFNTQYNNSIDYPLADRDFGDLFNTLYGVYGMGRDSSDTRAVFSVLPSYTLSSGKIKLQLGAKYTGYDRGEGFKSKIYPVVDFSVKVAEEFVPFAGLDGGIEMNDYKTISSENPYILPGMNMAMNVTDRSYSITGGAKGNIGNIFAYNIYGRYSLYKDMYFYVNTGPTSYPLENNFDVLYDDVQQWKVGAEMKVSTGPVQASLSGAYFSYVLDKLEAPLHRPALVADQNVDVAAYKSLLLNLNMHFQDKSPYAYNTAAGENEYNDAFFDLGLGAEYIFNRNFSVFVAVNNLLNRKYEKWHLYKVPGIGVLGGVTVKL